MPRLVVMLFVACAAYSQTIVFYSIYDDAGQLQEKTRNGILSTLSGCGVPPTPQK